MVSCHVSDRRTTGSSAWTAEKRSVWLTCCFVCLFIGLSGTDAIAQTTNHPLAEEFDFSVKEKLMVRRLESCGAKFHSVAGELGVELPYGFPTKDDGTEFHQLVEFVDRLPLTRLTIYGGSGVPKEQFAELLNRVELESLCLINFVGDEECLAMIAEHTSIESLSIQSEHLTLEILRSYTNLNKLRSLVLTNSQQGGLDPELLVAVSELDSLTSLCLIQFSLEQPVCSAVCELESLKNLSLVGCSWEGECWSNLSDLKNVHSLVFNDCKIDRVTSRLIGRMSNVDSLHFYSTDIDDEKIKDIVPCLGSEPTDRSNLTMDLSGTLITESTLRTLAELELPFNSAQVTVPDDLKDALEKFQQRNWFWKTSPRNARAAPAGS